MLDKYSEDSFSHWPWKRFRVLLECSGAALNIVLNSANGCWEKFRLLMINSGWYNSFQYQMEMIFELFILHYFSYHSFLPWCRDKMKRMYASIPPVPMPQPFCIQSVMCLSESPNMNDTGLLFWCCWCQSSGGLASCLSPIWVSWCLVWANTLGTLFLKKWWNPVWGQTSSCCLYSSLSRE